MSVEEHTLHSLDKFLTPVNHELFISVMKRLHRECIAVFVVTFFILLSSLSIVDMLSTIHLPKRFNDRFSRTRLFTVLKQGLEVRLRNGESGWLIEKSKSGWWKVEIHDGVLNANRIINIRANNFTAIENNQSIVDKDMAKSFQETIISTPKVEPSFSHTDATALDPSINTIDVPKRHRSMDHWILFSDLHVKSASIEYCEEVLSVVHQEALKRNAGIIFLGDFWHVRGGLSVELLNRVMSTLQSWKQPVIMIPGLKSVHLHSYDLLKSSFYIDNFCDFFSIPERKSRSSFIGRSDSCS